MGSRRSRPGSATTSWPRPRTSTSRKEVTRQIYSIRANVEPGNSGGPLLAPNGRVDGVVFAAAVGVKDTGYALTASEVESDARSAATAERGVSTLGV